MPHTPFGRTDRKVYILDVTGHDPGSLTFISSHQFVGIYESAKWVRIPAEITQFSIIQHVQTDSRADTDHPIEFIWRQSGRSLKLTHLHTTPNLYPYTAYMP